MKASIQAKVENLCDRHEEVSALLGDGEVIADQNRFRDLSREFSQLDDVVKVYRDYLQTQEDLASAQEMLSDADADVREMAGEEISLASDRANELDAQLEILLLQILFHHLV